MPIELAVTLYIVCFTSYLYLIVCRKKVLKEVKKKSGTVTRIKWTPWVEIMAEEWRETRFEVHYKDRDGTPHVAICKTAPFSDVYWREKE